MINDRGKTSSKRIHKDTSHYTSEYCFSHKLTAHIFCFSRFDLYLNESVLDFYF